MSTKAPYCKTQHSVNVVILQHNSSFKFRQIAVFTAASFQMLKVRRGKKRVFIMPLSYFQPKLSRCSTTQKNAPSKRVFAAEHARHAPLFPFCHCHPPRYSINRARHWNWGFVKCHLYLSWIKNGIVGRQSSYSKHFSETGMAELPNTTSVSACVARRGCSVRLVLLSFMTSWLTRRAFH